MTDRRPVDPIARALAIAIRRAIAAKAQEHAARLERRRRLVVVDRPKDGGQAA